MVQKFIDGKYVSGAAPVADRKKAAVPATEWLIKAVVYAHTDPEIKKAAIDLLVTTFVRAKFKSSCCYPMSLHRTTGLSRRSHTTSSQSRNELY